MNSAILIRKIETFMIVVNFIVFHIIIIYHVCLYILFYIFVNNFMFIVTKLYYDTIGPIKFCMFIAGLVRIFEGVG